ncbi:putative peptide hydrolase [Saccharomycopsis crataegensis]|uniref:Peptide hydrolase n=1 Tax=Saccharomycopsis crataegensis TaxID=43959 RepID=A0AAV5QSS3_9ASCO|nr:putative peptide hydrolase [Saccharomycopsis crataegensis]
MCGRFVFTIEADQIPQVFKDVHQIHNVVVVLPRHAYKSYNISPTNYSPVLYKNYSKNESGDSKHKGEYIARYMKFGLLPSWAKDQKKFSGYRTFNARKESLKPSSRLWGSYMKHQRCVIPVEGYYEWIHEKTPASKKAKKAQVNKRPYYIRKQEEGKVLFLAGLWSRSELKEKIPSVDKVCGYEDKTSEPLTNEVCSFTIITASAPKQLKWLHERMPIVLEPNSEAWNKWLDVDANESFTQPELEEILKHYDIEDLEWFEVSQEVNNTKNDGKQLIERINSEGDKGTTKKKRKDDISLILPTKKKMKVEDDHATKQEEDERATASKEETHSENEKITEEGGVKEEEK